MTSAPIYRGNVVMFPVQPPQRAGGKRAASATLLLFQRRFGADGLDLNGRPVPYKGTALPG
jgi:hypothetical protein